MKDILLSVPDKDYPFFIKLIKDLDFVQIKEKKPKISVTKQEIFDGIKEAIEEVNLAKQGKIKLK